MKIKEIEHKDEYSFILKFENDEIIPTNLRNLISGYVDLKDLVTAHINKEWGCLEFKNGKVDIEPKTLYNFAKNRINN